MGQNTNGLTQRDKKQPFGSNINVIPATHENLAHFMRHGRHTAAATKKAT